MEPSNSDNSISIRQTSGHPCPQCGSCYRRGDLCNICGTWAPVPVELDRGFSREGKACRGRVWDKKLHRYVG
jgi:hypothetical protein